MILPLTRLVGGRQDGKGRLRRGGGWCWRPSQGRDPGGGFCFSDKYSAIFIIKEYISIYSLFLPALLRYNWHITLRKFKLYNVTIWYMYTLQNDYNMGGFWKWDWHIADVVSQTEHTQPLGEMSPTPFCSSGKELGCTVLSQCRRTSTGCFLCAFLFTPHGNPVRWDFSHLFGKAGNRVMEG